MLLSQGAVRRLACYRRWHFFSSGQGLSTLRVIDPQNELNSYERRILDSELGKLERISKIRTVVACLPHVQRPLTQATAPVVKPRCLCDQCMMKKPLLVVDGQTTLLSFNHMGFAALVERRTYFSNHMEFANRVFAKSDFWAGHVDFMDDRRIPIILILLTTQDNTLSIVGCSASHRLRMDFLRDDPARWSKAVTSKLKTVDGTYTSFTVPFLKHHYLDRTWHSFTIDNPPPYFWTLYAAAYALHKSHRMQVVSTQCFAAAGILILLAVSSYATYSFARK
jgi:hypothetical protein